MVGRPVAVILAIVGILSMCVGSYSVHAEPILRAAVFDDFNGPAGTLPDSRLWTYDMGTHQDAGLQAYTNSPENVRLDGEGHLVIQARRTPGGYTSARPITRGKRTFFHGTLAARIKFPAGQGIWPAFWLLGSNFSEVGWPRCGEIDIMELVNAGDTYHVSLHGPQGNTDYLGGTERGGRVVGTSGPTQDLTDDFRVYWLNWQPNDITIGVDNTTLGNFTPASLPLGAQWVFNQPMFVLLNIAVGGPWPGPPDQSTPFPATMLIDWFDYTPGTGH